MDKRRAGGKAPRPCFMVACDTFRNRRQGLKLARTDAKGEEGAPGGGVSPRPFSAWQGRGILLALKKVLSYEETHA